MSRQKKNISPKAWGRSFLRTFLIQALWNGERMQNIGFAYCLMPLFDEKRPDDNAEMMDRHLEFFNTNPYMSGAIVGAVGRMEADGINPDEIMAFKRSLMGPFGALGDSLFWSSLKPAATLFGAYLLAGGNAFCAIAATLVVYNIPHLWTRAWGFWTGVNMGRWVVYRFSRVKFSRLKAMLGVTSALLLAAITVHGGDSGGLLGATAADNKLAAGIVAAGVVLLAAEAVKRGLKAERLFYLAGALSVAACLIAGWT